MDSRKISSKKLKRSSSESSVSSLEDKKSSTKAALEKKGRAASTEGRKTPTVRKLRQPQFYLNRKVHFLCSVELTCKRNIGVYAYVPLHRTVAFWLRLSQALLKVSGDGRMGIARIKGRSGRDHFHVRVPTRGRTLHSVSQSSLKLLMFPSRMLTFYPSAFSLCAEIFPSVPLNTTIALNQT